MSAPSGGPHTAETSIRLRPPFDGDRLLSFLEARAVTGVETVVGREYRRSIRLPRSSGTLRLAFPEPDTEPVIGVRITVADPADVSAARQLACRLVDADIDPDAVTAVLAADPLLARARRAYPGMRPPGAVDGAEILVRAIVGQQISVAAARTGLNRLAALVGERCAVVEPGIELLFPSGAGIAALGLDALAGPRRRAQAMIGACAAVAAGDLDLSHGRPTAELTRDLVALPGIGPWTADYVALRLGEPDVLLTGDLVLRQGAAALGLPSQPRELAAHGERWSPYRSYAGMLLWASAPAATPRARPAAAPPGTGAGPTPGAGLRARR